MVFKLDKLPFDHDDSMQLSFQHVGQQGSGVGFESFLHGCISERQHFPDGARHESDPGPEVMTAVAIDGNSVSTSNGESVRLGKGKRPFAVEDVQVATKRGRQMEGNCPPSRVSREGSFSSITGYGDFTRRQDAAASVEHARDSHGSSYSFPWFTFCPRQEVRSSFFPEYFEDHQQRTVRYNQLEEIRSQIFNYHPRKLVALGPNHQADVPVWRPKSFVRAGRQDDPDASTSYDAAADGDSDKWIGHSVMPVPDSDPGELEGRQCKATDCCCLDEGSIRCVKQHVTEARERLRIGLGRGLFGELGFRDMGEDVALRWSEDEEQLFHEVVMSNPASSGKNFWADLPRVFPSRSSKELVSYYFNVFMLRKRAEQNRSDPHNVDSDNDEWQESDDGEFVTAEEDDDSGVESPADATAAVGEANIHEAAEGDDDDDNVKLKFDLAADPADDSCTSYEGGQHNVAAGHIDAFESRLRDVEGNRGFDRRSNGMSSLNDLKPWDIGSIGGCVQGFEKHLDFLPTCNVIEEVFGNESWEKNREGHGVS